MDRGLEKGFFIEPTVFTEAPWGGYKQSGIGKSLGTYGLEDFQEIEQININLNPGMAGWFKG